MMKDYPPDLVCKLRECWDTLIRAKQLPIQELPDDDALLELLEVAYHASFLTEESRRLNFQLLFCDKDAFLHKCPRYPCSGDPIPFETHRNFTEQEIRRLAPATDFRRVMIAVDSNRSENSEQPKLRIWGMIDTGSSWWKCKQHVSDTGYSPPDLLTVSSAEPGTITISRSGHTVSILSGGNIRPLPNVDIFHKGESIGGFLADAQQHLAQEVFGDWASINDVSWWYLRCMKRILLGIAEQSHGGTLLIVPDGSEIKELEIKYRCNEQRAWNCLGRQLKLNATWNSKMSEWTAKTTTATNELGVALDLKAKLDRAEEQLLDSLRFISTLTGVDGAVVITDRLRVRGFGAEIVVRHSCLAVVSATDGKPIDVESVGTRHRSAYRYCNAHPEAITFVVSQDGDIKAVKKDSEVVKVWTDFDV